MSSPAIPAPPPLASATVPGLMGTGAQTFAGDKTFSGTVVASNLSGTNTGNVSLAAVGSSPNANGASLSGQALTLQPADATNPGVVTTGAQTIAGAKTFSGAVISTRTGGAAITTNPGAGQFHLARAGGGWGIYDNGVTDMVFMCNATGMIYAQFGTGVIIQHGYLRCDGASGSDSIRISTAGSRLHMSAAGGSDYLTGDGATAVKAAGKLTAATGLGAGNSAAAGTLGTVVKKLEVFAADGTTSLGFLPIYDAIT